LRGRVTPRHPAEVSIAAFAFPIICIGGPAALGVAGLWQARREPRANSSRPAWTWRLSVASALFCALAFNLVFFVQELFLVIPKALTPGLHPVLFHNNHIWTGDNPIAGLLQGTGAAATLLLGAACLGILIRRPPASATVRLFMAWLALHGLSMALLQVAVGAFAPGNDVGMAMAYLKLDETVRTLAALVALGALAAACLALVRPFLSFASSPAEIETAARRSRFIFRVATLPGFAAVLLIIPFRMPRDVIEVAVLPLVVIIAGVGWIQAGVWRVPDAAPQTSPGPISIVWPAGALAGVLLAFQLLLRPGVQF
jgi:hypothetical protein